MNPEMERDLRRQSKAVDWHRMPHNHSHHPAATIGELKARARRRKATQALRMLAQTWRRRR